MYQDLAIWRQLLKDTVCCYISTIYGCGPEMWNCPPLEVTSAYRLCMRACDLPISAIN